MARREPLFPHVPKRRVERSILALKLREAKDKLEDIYRSNPDEFYRRKKLIKQAIQERRMGQVKTMPDLTLDELNELLKFTGRLYG